MGLLKIISYTPLKGVSITSCWLMLPKIGKRFLITSSLLAID
jgi:hypothetical protein